IEARVGFEQHFLHRVGDAVEFTENLRMQRRLLRHRQQARARQDLLSEKCRLFKPRLAVGKNRHLEMRVHEWNGGIAGILFGNLPSVQNSAYEREQHDPRNDIGPDLTHSSGEFSTVDIRGSIWPAVSSCQYMRKC